MLARTLRGRSGTGSGRTQVPHPAGGVRSAVLRIRGSALIALPARRDGPSERNRGASDDRGSSADQTVRREDRGGPAGLYRQTGECHGVSRAQRRREVHHHADDHRVGRAHRWVGGGERAAVRRARRAVARGRGAARGQVDPSRSDRVQPPARAGLHARDPAAAGGRGHRADGTADRT
jgi:hypothetical protein